MIVTTSETREGVVNVPWGPEHADLIAHAGEGGRERQLRVYREWGDLHGVKLSRQRWPKAFSRLIGYEPPAGRIMWSQSPWSDAFDHRAVWTRGGKIVLVTGDPYTTAENPERVAILDRLRAAGYTIVEHSQESMRSLWFPGQSSLIEAWMPGVDPDWRAT
jgi:hypothetical protein